MRNTNTAKIAASVLAAVIAALVVAPAASAAVTPSVGHHALADGNQAQPDGFDWD